MNPWKYPLAIASLICCLAVGVAGQPPNADPPAETSLALDSPLAKFQLPPSFLLAQVPPPATTPTPGPTTPVVVEEPIKVVAPETVPAWGIVDIAVTVPASNKSKVHLRVFEGKSASKTSPSSLDEDVTLHRVRAGLTPNTWSLFGKTGTYRIIAVVCQGADKEPAYAETMVQVGPILEPDPVDPVDPIDPVDPVDPGKVTRVTYVFEKDLKNTPRAIAAALQKLNASGDITATEFEEDTVDGNGEVPEQYKVALEAARKAGLPALVVQAGAVVKRVVKDPNSEAQVTEALK